MKPGSLYICNFEVEDNSTGHNVNMEERLHVFDGPFDTLVGAKIILKDRRGIIDDPVIVKIVGWYKNYIQGNEMFSNKDGMALPDDTEMKIH
jgi:hypothetical protein